MNPAWSICSGGRLNTQLLQGATFKITTDEKLESVLFRSVAQKKAFANTLRRKLSGLATAENYQHVLTVNFQSAVVKGEFDRRGVELTVLVKDEETDTILWYFILQSAAIHISAEDTDEIVSIIIARICSGSLVQKQKCWL